ncbi:competence protein ComK [Desertibacillus haloalkaliphilus]|uniref:competence protein ComK n=1 Tax=Desertibacillus haloalkaliphilus TaxID=1328930 RepID=UPI001C274A88|nr:competence protein ComK [Desertibacillus haloalkaliphilus]MBU8906535.1 competence protein ComK [Desertibacillus haloalkaliphilus]
MTIAILETYEITRDTIALLPAKHTDYDTIALEFDRELYIKQPPLSLIKTACLEGGSTYDGRRDAVTHLTGAQNKVPIPIDPIEQIYAFPTNSPSQFDCIWIFYPHVKSIQPDHTNINNSSITLKNNRTLALNASYASLEKQVHRTSYCIIRFSQPFQHPAYTARNHALTQL